MRPPHLGNWERAYEQMEKAMQDGDERAKKAKAVLRLGVAMPIADVAHNEQVSEDYCRGVWDGWRLHLEDLSEAHEGLEAERLLARGYADELREAERVASEFGLAGPGAAHERMAEAIRLLRAVLSTQCLDHANACCADWCQACADQVRARAALDEPVPPRTGVTEKNR